MNDPSRPFSIFTERIRSARGLQYRGDLDAPLIEVDEAMRTIAGFYERTRNTLEYGEADFLRQRAIERSLRRMLGFGSATLPVRAGDEGKALEFLRELVRAGYLPNAALPETIALPVGRTITRFLALSAIVNPLFHDELLRFTVFTIEDVIFPRRAAAHSAMVAFVLATCETRLKWPQIAFSDPSHRAFLFAAAHRAVLNAGTDRILAAFLGDALPALREDGIEDPELLARDFESVLTVAKRTIAHPRTEQYARVIRRFAAAFRALDAVVFTAVDDGIPPHDTLELERRIDEAVAVRIADARRKMRVAAVRATLYVFFTKMLVGLGIELPYDYFFLAHFAAQPFLINLLFPPALMFLVAFSARPPKAAVADRIVDEALRIAAGTDSLGHARLPRKRGPLRLGLFIIATGLLSGGALTLIVRGLALLGFSPVAMVVFLAFLSLVSVFAWRVRKPLRELAVSGGRGVLGTILEIFAFPFLALGRILSDGLASFNVFLFLLDVFIEAPLKFLFAAAEDWIAFLREKREEMIEE